MQKQTICEESVHRQTEAFALRALRLRRCAATLRVIGSGRLCAGQADWIDCAQRGRLGRV